jgi:predicted dehydrogenase
MKKENGISRRNFLSSAAKATLAFTIVPRFVLGGKNYIAPSDQLNVGFIGTGKQGRILMNGFANKVQLIAGADVDAKKLLLFKELTEKKYADLKDVTSYKGLKTYSDFRELLANPEIDAVVVATPDHWHAVNSVMAANAKKHVYCEKPMAHSVAEGRAMVNAATSNNIILQTGSMQRSWKNFRTACELVRNGYLGDVKEVWVSVGDAAIPCYLQAQPIPEELNWDMFLGPSAYLPFNPVLAPPSSEDIYPNWRLYKEIGGGILSDWGAHMFDIAQWGLGKDNTGPVKYFPPDGKGYNELTMVYDDGIVMKHKKFGRGHGVRFIGSKGTLDISRSYFDSKPDTIAQQVIKENEIHLYNSDDHYGDWINAIKNNKQPICNAETGHRTSSICCIANIAYWLNRPLTFNAVKETFLNDNEANALLKPKLRKPWNVL